MSYRDRVKKAVERYNKKNSKEKKSRAKKNSAPEKAVVKDCLKWLRNSGFDVNVVEAKAVYSEKAGRYMASPTTPGMSDICGNAPNGIGAFIEVKAPGRLATLRSNQRNFLIKKIDSNCFAVCVDSQDSLQSHYHKWIACLGLNQEHAKEYLRNSLPAHKPGTVDDDAPLDFSEDDELPF